MHGIVWSDQSPITCQRFYVSMHDSLTFLLQFFEVNKEEGEKESTSEQKDISDRSVTDHRPLPLSSSWANFDDNKLDDFSQHFTPISEEDDNIIVRTRSVSSSIAAVESAFGEQQTSTVEDNNSPETDNPFRRDSFVGLREKVRSGTDLQREDTQTSAPFSSSKAEKAFGSTASDNHSPEEDNPFHNDFFVDIKEDKDVSPPQETVDTKQPDPFNSGETKESSSDRKEDNPFHKDSFVELKEDKDISPPEETTAARESGGIEDSSSDSKEDNSFSQGNFVGFTEKELDNFPTTVPQHSDPFNDNLEDTAKAAEKETGENSEQDLEEFTAKKEASELKGPATLETVVEEPVLSDPFLQSDPFGGSFVSTTASAIPSLANSLPEEEPRSKFHLITPHSELHLSNTDNFFSDFSPFVYDPFEEEPFFSEGVKTDLQANSEFVSAFDQFDSAINNLPDHLFESSNALDSNNSSFDFQGPFDSPSDESKPVDPVDSQLDHSQPVDSHTETLSQSDIESHCLDEMAVDVNNIPDLQDLDSAFTLDDLSNVIAEMELVSESLNEEPSPPPAVEKPKAPPPVATKKYERKPFRTNDQSPKKPESFLNEVNMEKNKTSPQKIDLDIAGDVFSELEAQLQQELSDDAPPGKSADQVPDEVKEVLKELNAPYSMGLEDIESDLGMKSGDSKDNVGDLISQLQGDFDDMEGTQEEENEPEENGDVEFEEEDDTLKDQFAGSSMDDLLSQLKGMEDDDDTMTVPPPTLPKPSKVTHKEELIEDPV